MSAPTTIAPPPTPKSRAKLAPVFGSDPGVFTEGDTTEPVVENNVLVGDAPVPNAVLVVGAVVVVGVDSVVGEMGTVRDGFGRLGLVGDETVDVVDVPETVVVVESLIVVDVESGTVVAEVLVVTVGVVVVVVVGANEVTVVVG